MLPSWAFASRAIHSCWWWFYMSKSNGGRCQAEPLPTELYTPAGGDSTCQNQTEDVAKYTLLLVVILHVKIKRRTLPSWTLANRAIHSCWWRFYMSKSNGGRCQVYTPAGGDSTCQNQTEDVAKLNPCQQSYTLLLVAILHVKIKRRTLPSIHSCWWWFCMSKSNWGCDQAEPFPTELVVILQCQSHLQMEDVAKPSPCQQSCPPLPTEFPFGGFSTLRLKNTVKDAEPVYCGNWHGNNKMWWEINFLLWHHLSNSTLHPGGGKGNKEGTEMKKQTVLHMAVKILTRHTPLTASISPSIMMYANHALATKRNVQEQSIFIALQNTSKMPHKKCYRSNLINTLTNSNLQQWYVEIRNLLLKQNENLHTENQRMVTAVLCNGVAHMYMIM